MTTQGDSLCLGSAMEESDFVKKVYDLVNDPSTDAVISWKEDGIGFTVWHPEECCRNELPHFLGINTFKIFSTMGFRRSQLRGLLSFVHSNFVRDRPDLLVNIAKPRWYPTVAMLEAARQVKECKDPNRQAVLLKEFRARMKRDRTETAKAALLEELRALKESIDTFRQEEGAFSDEAHLQLNNIVMGV